MPAWRVGELPAPPVWTRAHWTAMIGPGLTLAGASVAGGEWLLGPRVGAQFGGALLWIAVASLACQYVYNVEATRYTLYTGESVLTGAFRVRPGPLVWFWLYLAMDLGSLLPYQVASVATPVAAIWLGRMPNPADPAEVQLLRFLTYAMLTLALLPLVFGGKVYNALKLMMTTKIVFVFSFLIFLAIFYSSWATWADILSGLFKVGTVPAAGGGTTNVLLDLWRGLPIAVDREALTTFTAFAAIAGVGGLQQASISNYTREQGWGMGGQVGAIPSLIGGRKFSLSHAGVVFPITAATLARWAGWLRHVKRDQLAMWFPAAVIGIALPTMLSIEYLPRGTKADSWILAGMTADGLAARVGGSFGSVCWYAILVCGVLVLLPSAASGADGFLRRWLDIAWTGLPVFQRMETHRIRYVYFGFLLTYFLLGLVFLSIARPLTLVVIYGNMGNLALGVNCFHTIRVNRTLLPPDLRPGWARCTCLAIAGVYYVGMAAMTAAIALQLI